MALPEIKTILYTSSLGAQTRPVFRQAVQLAHNLKARVIMLHVVEPVGEMGRALIHSYLPDDVIKKMHDEGINRVLEQMKERLEKFRDEELKAIDRDFDFDIEPVVAEGQHAETILRQAEKLGADLIVMGQENTFGHHSPTTHHVVRQAKIPVFVVPTGKQYL
ncbi:Universal stress protein family [Marinobacterium lacunae]|uniref:Universal stress protein family n=1 Tax=Marinobacterium lacunae TaxID=1232683 RepID=A0A081G3R6_9GAMM|nr:universal stress protein [Marinobacterium lacunae]KEA65421.1 Universal stress protein family [Marinobacterium lacunae]MBR9884682.1 universal stress protein [Oceanospirillales bacterium]